MSKRGNGKKERLEKILSGILTGVLGSNSNLNDHTSSLETCTEMNEYDFLRIFANVLL